MDLVYYGLAEHLADLRIGILPFTTEPIIETTVCHFSL